jgi:predicted transcriptional regulator
MGIEPEGTAVTKESSMTVKQFAERAEISLSLAYTLIAEGRVQHRRIGQRGKRGKIIVLEEDLQAFLDEAKVEIER